MEITGRGYCGTPLAGRYDYLPGQVFVALGILDRAEDFAPNSTRMRGSG